MKILLVAATHFEIEGILLALSADANTHTPKQVEYLVTGPGIFHTAYEFGRYLNGKQFDLALNVGIAGVFHKSVPLGTVFNVVEDCFADFGAEDGNDYLSAFEIGLVNGNQFPFEGSKLKNRNLGNPRVLNQFPEAKGITVNTVHGSASSIKKLTGRIDADIESMEGAAFFYICRVNNVPCLQIRAVSNYIERRNRKAWNIPLALDNLSAAVVEIIREMLKTKAE